MSSAERYLNNHPTPWRLVRYISTDNVNSTKLKQEAEAEGYEVVFTDGQETEAVLDRNGDAVITARDSEGLHAWFEGDLAGLVEVVNVMGLANAVAPGVTESQTRTQGRDANRIIASARRAGANPLQDLYHAGFITEEHLKEARGIHAVVTAPFEDILDELRRRAEERGIK